MKAWIACLAIALPALAQEPEPQAQDELPVPLNVDTLERALPDGLTMKADYYAPRSVPKGPIVVACHMAGSSRGEYQKIAPQFVNWGCSLLAVDLRAGKERNDVPNELAAAFEKKKGAPATYAEAYVDVVEAVKWARELRPEANVVLMGSSYSAALAMAYAGREPAGVDAVLAFSPGEYIEGWSVAMDVRKATVPVYVSCGSGPEEKAKATRVFNAVDKKLRSSFFPNETLTLAHGAESLVQEDSNVHARVWHGVYKIVKALTLEQGPEEPGK